jgi:hypothetical protein
MRVRRSRVEGGDASMSLVVRVCLGGNDIQTAKVGSCSVDRFPYDPASEIVHRGTYSIL